jgi:hypothetical protein
MEGDLAFHTFLLSTLPIARHKSSKTKIFENMSKFHVYKQLQTLSNFKRPANDQKKKKYLIFHNQVTFKQLD